MSNKQVLVINPIHGPRPGYLRSPLSLSMRLLRRYEDLQQPPEHIHVIERLCSAGGGSDGQRSCHRRINVDRPTSTPVHRPRSNCSIAVCLAALRSRARRRSATGSSGSCDATT